MMHLFVFLFLFLQSGSKGELVNQKSIAEKVFAQVNKERQKKGLSALTWNVKLDSATRLHASQMAQLNFFSHYHPSNKAYYSHSDRMRYFKYNFKLNGENNATQSYSSNMLPKDEEIVSKFIYIWINSPVHYKTMFTPEFKDAAISVISVPRPGGVTKYYTVMNFGVQ